MGVIKEKFGVTKDGREVYAYTLSNANGMSAKIIDYGAVVSPSRLELVAMITSSTSPSSRCISSFSLMSPGR